MGNVGKGGRNLVTGVTGGVGDGVTKLGKGEVLGGLGSTVGGLGTALGGFASGIAGYDKEEQEIQDLKAKKEQEQLGMK